MKKSTKIVRTVLLILVSFAFLAGGVTKFIGGQEAAMFASLHLESTLAIIGMLELLIVAGLWLKKTRTAAILLGTAILGAAIAETITLSLGMTPEIIAPGIILVATWVIFAIDHCDYTKKV